MQMIPAKALDQHIAVLGKTGSGKTFAVKGVVERLLDEGRQVCVLDPTGAWWGLRLDSNGKGRGYERVVLLARARSAIASGPARLHQRGMGRGVHGLPGRMADALNRCGVMAVGNAVVPQVVAAIAAGVLRAVRRAA